MTPSKRRLLTLGALVTLTVGAYALYTPTPNASGRAATLLLTSHAPESEDLQSSMRASDTLVGRLHAEGITDVEHHLRERLSTVPVTEAETRRFFDANSRTFGDRLYAEERDTAERLLRIHKLRREFGLPSPNNGLTYPE